MAITVDSLVRLKSQLLTSGLQDKNQALFQVINSLIDGVIQGFGQVNTQVVPAPGPTGIANQTFITAGIDTATLPNSRQLVAGEGIQLNPAPNGRLLISAAIPLGGDGGEGDGGDGPPGPQGPAGVAGAPGPAGLNAVAFAYGYDGEDGEDGMPGLNGPQGFTGAQGAVGPSGIMGLIGEDGDKGEDSFIPGPTGATGATGASGSASLTDFTKDLGAARVSGTFDITGLAGLTPNKNVIIVQTMQPIVSKGDARDEFEMDAIVLTGYVVDAATIRALWFSANGSVVVGTYAFAYAVSS